MATLLGSAAPSAPQRRSKGLSTGTATAQKDSGHRMKGVFSMPCAKGPSNYRNKNQVESLNHFLFAFFLFKEKRGLRILQGPMEAQKESS